MFMATLNGNDSQREKLRAVLLWRVENPGEAGQIARATLDLWGEVASRLVPVIGRRGVEALLDRCLHLTSLVCPWLGLPGEGEGGEALLGARLEKEGAASALEASLTLFLNLTSLLAALIGPSLTDRLLTPVWTAKAPPPGQELSS
jgi:hypothetical protein